MKKWITVLAMIILSSITIGDVRAQEVTVTYQVGIDTYLNESHPDTSYGTALDLWVHHTPGAQSLVRFDGVTCPPGRPLVSSAILKLYVFDPGLCGASVDRMLMPWSGSNTWNSWGNGISRDDLEAMAVPDATVPSGTMTLESGYLLIDVTAGVQAWVDGMPNYGWVISPLSADPKGWAFHSFEKGTVSLRPTLEVTCIPEPTTLSFVTIGLLTFLKRKS